MAQKLMVCCVVIVILFSFVQTASKIKRDGDANPPAAATDQKNSKKDVNNDGGGSADPSKNVIKPTEKPVTKTATDNQIEQDTKPSAATPSNKTDCEKTGNCTGSQWNNIYKTIKDNKGMLMRTFYVLIGVTTIVVVYFVIRAWRMRRRRSRSRKYGIITTRGSDLEMEPLDNDMNDEEDNTVFEQNSNRHR